MEPRRGHQRPWNWSCIWRSVLRTEPRIFGKAARALSQWAIFLHPTMILIDFWYFNVCDRGRRIYIPGFSKIQSFNSKCFKIVIFTIYQSLIVIDLNTKMYEFNLNFFQGVMMSKYFALQLFHLECDCGTRHRVLSLIQRLLSDLDRQGLLQLRKLLSFRVLGRSFLESRLISFYSPY